MSHIGYVNCTCDYYDEEWGSTKCHEDYTYKVYEHDAVNGIYCVETVDGWMTISEEEFNEHFEWVDDTN